MCVCVCVCACCKFILIKCKIGGKVPFYKAPYAKCRRNSMLSECRYLSDFVKLHPGPQEVYDIFLNTCIFTVKRFIKCKFTHTHIA